MSNSMTAHLGAYMPLLTPQIYCNIADALKDVAKEGEAEKFLFLGSKSTSLYVVLNCQFLK